jgi:flagellar hook-associated protein 3 FlgL
MNARIGDHAQASRVSVAVQQSQARVREAQLMIASGKVASSYASLPDKTALLLRAGQERAATSAWTEQGALVTDRLNAMNGALSAIGDVAERMRSLLVNRLDGSSGASVPLGEEVDLALAEVAGQLNLRVDGRYLFSGSRTDAPAVSLPDPPPTTADPTAYYDGDEVILAVRVGSDRELGYGMTAAEGGFARLISALGQARAGDAADDRVGLENALVDFNQAIEGIAELRGRAGATARQLETITEEHVSTGLLLDQLIARVEDTDIPSAMTTLALHQAGLEASYMTIGRLSSLSLADYLS